MSDLTSQTSDALASPFDSIKLPGDRWSARALMPMLGYEKWERFADRIVEARKAAEIVGAADQFADTGKMVGIGSGARREVADVEMTRYGAYMVAMSCDGRKQEVAHAKTYFAVKTREAEVRPAPSSLPSRRELAQWVVEAEERAELAESKLAELEPKADLADTYLTAQGGSRLVGQAAKLLGMKEKDFRRFLIDEKLAFTRHAPCGAIQWEHYAEFAHHFKASETVINHSHGTCTHYTLRILPRGMELIKKRMRDAGMLAVSA